MLAFMMTLLSVEARADVWPAVRRADPPAPLVRLGSSVVAERASLREHLLPVLEVYSRRPEKDNKCGIRINHVRRAAQKF